LKLEFLMRFKLATVAISTFYSYIHTAHSFSLFATQKYLGRLNSRTYALKSDEFAYSENVKISEERIEPTVYVDDLYGALGVSQNASMQELKDAYRSISFRNHPDRNKVSQLKS